MDSTLSADALLPAGNGEQQSLVPLTLDALLQPDSPGMSAFRVLYNLEVSIDIYTTTLMLFLVD